VLDADPAWFCNL